MKTLIRDSQNKTFIIWGLCLAFILLPLEAFSQSGGSGGSGGSKGFRSRAAARETKRWTLAEWLEQKDRNSLMDQWLTMNSSSPFEFYIKGASNSYEYKKSLTDKKKYISYSGSAAAYAQAVGLTGEYENNLREHYNDSAGMLSIRVLGNSLQTTSLTLHGGQRTRQYMETTTDKKTIRNLFGQATLQLYFTRYFGAFGSYRDYVPSDHSSLGKVSGTLVEGGLFIDFSGFRVYGNWNEDIQINKSDAGVTTKYRRTGIKSGVQIFF